MTVSSLQPVNNYTGNNSTMTFDFDFLIENESELLVTHINLDTNINTELVLGVDYSINEIGNKNGSYITFPLQSSSFEVLRENEILSLCLHLPIKQESEFENSADLRLDVLEWTFDYIIRILQILNRKIERSIKIDEGVNSTPENLLQTIYTSADQSKTYAFETLKNTQKSFSYAQSTFESLQYVENKANNNLDNLTLEGQSIISKFSQNNIPIGAQIVLAPSDFYVPVGCLPCDGAEYSKGQFKQLWDNYLIGQDVFDPDSITVVGNPTITDDGIASGFSGSNYLSISATTFNPKTSTWEIRGAFLVTQFTATQIIFTKVQNAYFGIRLLVGINQKLSLEISNNGTSNAFSVSSTNTITNNQKYYFKLYFTGTQYKLDVSTEGSNWINFITQDSTTTIYDDTSNIFTIGAKGSQYLDGSIDLKQFSITVDGQTVYDCVKQVPLLNTCSYEEYEQDLATYGQCSKFAVKPLEYDGSGLTIVGSPTITDDGIASGFSDSNYITIPFDYSNPIFEISLNVDYPTEKWAQSSTVILATFGTTSNFVRCGITSSGQFIIATMIDGTQNNMFLGSNSINTLGEKEVNIDFGYDGTIFYVKKNGILVGSKQGNTISSINSTFYIGKDLFVKKWQWLGSIDLKQFSITVDGQTVFSGGVGDTFRVPTISFDDDATQKFVVVSNAEMPESQIDWDKWATTLQRKANKADVDGTYKFSKNVLSTTTAIGSYELDLSEYLPNDNYDYEVILNASAYTTQTDPTKIYIGSDLILVNTSSEYEELILIVNTSSRGHSNRFVLPVGIQRKVYWHITNKTPDTCILTALGYRRIGRNK